MGSTGTNGSKSRFEDKLIWGLVIAIAIGIVAFGAFYYLDRYAYSSPAPIDREIVQLEQMVVNDPDNANVRLAVADRYSAKKLYERAIQQYKEALKLNENLDRAWAGLGYAQLASSRNEDAIASFKRALDLVKSDKAGALSPGVAAVRYYLGAAYSNQGELDKAIAEFRQVLEANRGDADATYQLALVLQKKGMHDDAIGLFNYATDLVPDFKEAYSGLAESYKAKGMATEEEYAEAMVDLFDQSYDQAIARLQKVIAAKSDFANAYFGLGLALEKKGKLNEAKEAYSNAVKYKNNYASAQAALARLNVASPKQ